MTLNELLNFWLDNYARAHCKKWKAFQREYELYVAPLGERELSSIRRADIVSLQATLERSKGKSAANAAVTLLSMLYNKAIDWELFIGTNPASRIRKFGIKPRDRFLQPEELPRFLAEVRRLKNPTTRDFFLTLLFTGQRRRNTAEMKWEQIDFNRCVWNLPDTKNGTSHTVPLIEPVMQILERRRACNNVWVFPREDGAGPIWCRSTAWKHVLARAGISNLRIHDLRRSLASWQAITGASLPIIGRTLNHQDTKSTMIYARLHLDPVRSSMSKAVSAMVSADEKLRLEIATDESEDWVSCQQIESELALTDGFLANLRSQYTGPAYLTIDSDVLYKPSTVKGWIQRHKVVSTDITIPYGYSKDADGKLRFNPKEQAWIAYMRWLHQFRDAQGKRLFGCQKIADRLNTWNVPSRTQKIWGISQVRNIVLAKRRVDMYQREILATHDVGLKFSSANIALTG